MVLPRTSDLADYSESDKSHIFNKSYQEVFRSDRLTCIVVFNPKQGIRFVYAKTAV